MAFPSQIDNKKVVQHEITLCYTFTGKSLQYGCTSKSPNTASQNLSNNLCHCLRGELMGGLSLSTLPNKHRLQLRMHGKTELKLRRVNLYGMEVLSCVELKIIFL